MGSTRNWIWTAINPSRNWLKITEFSGHGFWVTRVLRTEWNCRLTGKTRIRLSFHRTWTSLRHFSRNCHEGCQGLNRYHKNYWESLTGLEHAKGFPQGSTVRKTKEFLKINRSQLRWMTGLFTGHCHLKGHLFKIGLTSIPTCERCLEKDESATHTSHVIVRL
jgi:hypothetical protein